METVFGWSGDRSVLQFDPPTDPEDRKAILEIMKKAHEDHSWERYLEHLKEYDHPDYGGWKPDPPNPDDFSHGYEGIRLVAWHHFADQNEWGDTHWAEVRYAKKPWVASYGYSEIRGANCYCD